jgi:hypothetical protein
MIQRLTSQKTWRNWMLEKLLPYLPKDLVRQQLRKSLFVPTELDPRLTIQIAESREDFTGAFELAHQVYSDAHMIESDPSGLHVTPHHSLPFTKTVVAKWEGQVVGCITLAPDSQFGLPISSSFDLSELRRSDRRIVEAFGLAIRPDMASNFQDVILPLFKFVYHLLERYYRTDYLVVAVHPQYLPFCEGVLLLSPMTNQKWHDANQNPGQPLVGTYLNVKIYKLGLAAQYKGVPAAQNPLTFLGQSFANLKLPNLETFSVTQPSMTPETLDYFFNKRTNIFARLHGDKLNTIASLYNLDLYAYVLPQSDVNRRSEMIAREPRFHAELQGRVVTLDGQMQPLKIHDVSLSGFKATCQQKVTFGEAANVTVAIGEYDIVDIKAIPVRQGPDGSYGFQISECQAGWKFFIEMLIQDQQQQGSLFKINRVS